MDQKDKAPQKPSDGNDKRPKSSIWLALIITIALVLLIISVYNMVSDSKYTKTTYTEFRQELDAGNLSEVELQADRIIYMTLEEAAKDPSVQKACYTGLPSGGDSRALADELYEMGVKVYQPIVEDNTFIMTIFIIAR